MKQIVINYFKKVYIKNASLSSSVVKYRKYDISVSGINVKIGSSLVSKICAIRVHFSILSFVFS